MPVDDSTKWTLSHWAGAPAQLAEAARVAVAKLGALAPYPTDDDLDGHDAWLAAEAARQLSISVEEHDGYSSTLANLDELANIP